jgi:hypothetical protein
MDGKDIMVATGHVYPLVDQHQWGQVTRNNLSCFATFKMESSQESLQPRSGAGAGSSRGSGNATLIWMDELTWF